VFFGTIIVGLSFFFLISSIAYLATFLTIFFVVLIYTTIGELTIRMYLIFFLRSFLIFPFGSIFSYILNFFGRRYTYTSNDPHGVVFTFLVYVILFLVCGFGLIFGTLIARLINGYEALSKEPDILSYSIDKDKEKTTETLKRFLESLNITYNIITRWNQQLFKFYQNNNEYCIFTYPIDKGDHTEIDIVVWSWKKETIIKPNEENLEIFSEYLTSYMNIQKKEEKIGEWTSEFKPLNAEASKLRIWSELTSSLKIRERLSFRGALTQRIVSQFKAHKTRIIDVVVTLAVIIVAQFILYVLHWI
jgi:hypothetical protein